MQGFEGGTTHISDCLGYLIQKSKTIDNDYEVSSAYYVSGLAPVGYLISKMIVQGGFCLLCFTDEEGEAHVVVRQHCFFFLNQQSQVSTEVSQMGALDEAYPAL